jgi:hypothetical protein
MPMPDLRKNKHFIDIYGDLRVFWTILAKKKLGSLFDVTKGIEIMK